MKARKNVKASAVDEELPSGLSKGLLKELHLLTREGALNADARRKLKQVLHLVRLIEPAVRDLLARFPEPIIVDCGAGRSYLGFILVELLLAPANKGRIIAVESRGELADRGRRLAQDLGLERLTFLTSEVQTAELPERIHLVTALHACDTATDDALALAIGRRADHVAVVPCCQAEVARQLAEAQAPESSIHPLFAHPWHRREFGSHLTNVVRTLALESAGYQVTVTELSGWEHSLKNELILGKRVQRFDAQARARLRGLLGTFGIRPALVRALEGTELV